MNRFATAAAALAISVALAISPASAKKHHADQQAPVYAQTVATQAAPNGMSEREQRRLNNRLDGDINALKAMTEKGEIKGEADGLASTLSWMSGGEVTPQTARRLISILFAAGIVVGETVGFMVFIRVGGAIMAEEEKPVAAIAAPVKMEPVSKNPFADDSEAHETAPSLPAPVRELAKRRGEKSPSYRTPREDSGAPSIEEIKGLRQVLKMTQEQLGASIGASVHTISSWERANRNPTEPHFVSKLNELKKKARKILGGTGGNVVNIRKLT